MSSRETNLYGRNREAEQLALQREWRRLTRAATIVALLTSPVTFAFFYVQHDWPLLWALVGTAVFVIAFRGFMDVLAHRLIPRASLYGAGRELVEEDIVSRRRVWYWRTKFRRLTYLAIFVAFVLVAMSIAGIAFSDIGDFLVSALPFILIYGIQIPLLFFANILILFGPLLFFGLKQMKGYEPGDADWGVKLDDVRGQAEPKEEVKQVIELWSAGEEFRMAGGKPERGLLFIGAPGTGKTMLSKGIATTFNSPIVTMPGSGFAQTFIGMDVIVVMFLIRKARRLARKWGGQCIIFIDEIDAVGMRRNALQGASVRPAACSRWAPASRSRRCTARRARSPRPATSSSRRARGASGCSRRAPSSGPTRCRTRWPSSATRSTASCSRAWAAAAASRSTSCSCRWTASTSRRSCASASPSA